MPYREIFGCKLENKQSISTSLNNYGILLYLLILLMGDPHYSFLRFKRIFSAHWSTFVGNNPRNATHYYHSEVKKCCRVAVRRMGLRPISAWVR
ncbi:MAG: hypothetical protein ACI9Y1_000111 [Lentisphaeria bacterium]|jgi:hypothetical protein